MQWPRADLSSGLLVRYAVAFDEPDPECVDHRRHFVKALARLVHTYAEGGELAPRQPSAKPEAEAVLAQQVEQLRLLSDPEWVVPGMMTSAVPRSILGQPAAK